ncbi:ABC transporter substrate-binding protein [Cryptosporangium sp. NPDC048952]|uniref:ABC transporter substrate-binding protein n=1 Tax=Cryptosporangium sp. NPDC048952 TaxID=3363961 RepID=UPI003718D6F5
MTIKGRLPMARIALAGLALALTAATTGCGGSSADDAAVSSGKTPSAADPVRLRIAYNLNPTNLTILVADKQGFFTKNGLDVELTTSQAAAGLLPSVGKQYDLITATPPTLLQAAARGIDPLLVSAQTIENNADLRSTYFLGAKGINSVKDLKGKTIAVPSQSGNLYEGAVVALHGAGLKKSDVKFLQIPFADMAAGLQKGTFQAAVTIFPFQGQMLGQGAHDLGNSTVDISDGTALAAGWAASKKWAEANGPTIAAFRKASEDAVTWLEQNVDAGRQLLVTELKLPEQVAKTYPVTKSFSFDVKPEYLEPWIEPMKEVGDLPNSFDTKAEDLVHAP